MPDLHITRSTAAVNRGALPHTVEHRAVLKPNKLVQVWGQGAAHLMRGHVVHEGVQGVDVVAALLCRRLLHHRVDELPHCSDATAKCLRHSPHSSVRTCLRTRLNSSEMNTTWITACS